MSSDHPRAVYRRRERAQRKQEAEDAALAWVTPPRHPMVLVPVVDMPQISDEAWQRMARERLTEKQSPVHVERRHSAFCEIGICWCDTP